MGLAPALVGLERKTRTNPGAEDACIAKAVQAHRGCDWKQPVVFGKRIVGLVEGRRQHPEVTFRSVKPIPLSCVFNTYDDLIAACSAGRFYAGIFAKSATTAGVAFNWYDQWPVGGNPSSGAYGGAAFTAVQKSDSTVGSMYMGGNVSTFTKSNTGLWISATAGTPTWVVYDRVLTYEACTYNAAVNQAMTNTLPAQRYISAGQAGLKIIVTAQTVNGATANNLTQLQYTNQNGTALQSMPTSPTVSQIVSGAAPTATLGSRVISPATTATTLTWGYTLPLAAGDSGARLIANYTTSAANTGTICFVLGFPLFTLGIATAGVISQADAVYQIPNLRQIIDGACISFLAFFPAATGATIQGEFDAAWN
jgi:hypothetical protein